jgi:RimJ/RimL family protein N-acetyltransferase
MSRAEAWTTQRLTIETLTVDHAEHLIGLVDPEVNAYFDGPPRTLDDLRIRFSRMIAGPGDRYPGETWLNFAVKSADSDTYLGRIEATIQKAYAEVAFIFAKEAWGQGYAFEASCWLESHCAFNFGVLQFWGTVAPANARSIALLKRLGYQETTREAWPVLTSYDEGDLVFFKPSA